MDDGGKHRQPRPKKPIQAEVAKHQHVKPASDGAPEQRVSRVEQRDREREFHKMNAQAQVTATTGRLNELWAGSGP
jgi:hypothetical protein